MENLKIVTVAPITKTVLTEDLTYFTTKEIKTGALVTIPLKNKDIPGIVISVSRAEEIKSDLKTSPYQFKKIKKILADNVYSDGFLSASRESAEFFITSTGQIIRSLTPKAVLGEWQKGDTGKISKADDETRVAPDTSRRFEIAILGLPDDERYSFYKSLIREEFARKHSVMFILPTIHDTEECEEILRRGIEEYTVLLHGRLTPKMTLERWNRAQSEKHPILIIATPTFLSLYRNDLATIIIDKEGSPYYKTMTRPLIDVRTFAEKLARQYSARIVLGDFIPRVEEIYSAEAGNYIQESPLRYRFPQNFHQEVIDTRKTPSILSPKVKQALRESVEKKERSLIICARKGLGTSTVCSDCGELIACPSCSRDGQAGLPMVVHKIRNVNTFLCNYCGKMSPTDVLCTKCRSWKLKMYGVATEGVEEAVKTYLPATKIFRIDGNAIKNYKQAQTVISEFLSTPGAILIGTEMILGYLNQNIETVVVASIDTLFSIPDFRADESIFNLLTRLRQKTLKRFLIQTRRPEEKIFEHVITGDLLEFYREEIRGRKKFGYPPFKILLKVTAEGPERATNKEMAQLESFLRSYSSEHPEVSVERTDNKERINIILKIEPTKWPGKNEGKINAGGDTPYSSLIEILKSLPKRFVVRVDPENIL